MTEPRVMPFIKWAGGKGKSADKILELLPVVTPSVTYREPFLGGGAIFFALRPKRAVLSDILVPLVNAYRAVKVYQDSLEARLLVLDATYRIRAKAGDEKVRAYFAGVRASYNARASRARDHEPTDLDLAAELIFLNKTCFNGLYRTNKKGVFNVPFGDYANPKIRDHEKLAAAGAALRRADADLLVTNYTYLIDEANPGDVIYLDPPYVPVSKTSSFTSYAGGFGPADQDRLAELFRELDARGCKLALSNADAPRVRELYKGYDVTEIPVGRAINSKTTKRGKVTELLIRNIKKYP